MNQDNKANGQAIINYLNKYIENNHKCFDFLNKLTVDPHFENNFSKEEWFYIVDEALKMAYAKAMEDNKLSPIEKLELQKIENLRSQYRYNPFAGCQLTETVKEAYRTFNRPMPK